jgi:RNA polymerase sigma factor (sigma-70 family)
MVMQSRQSIIEIFSTFVQFDADRFSGWATESKLRRSMQSCLQQIPKETRENFWVMYWYQVLQVSDSKFLAQQHLTAYLQECCYWTSQKTSAHFVSSQYKLADCFQIAIAQVDKVLQGFNPSHSSSLTSYASIVFANTIRETLRRNREVDICTDWGLLRKISQKRLHESLQNAGLSSETVNAYILTWQCFKALYVPSQAGKSRQLSPPDQEMWQAIAQAYNTQTHAQVKPHILAGWLVNTARAVRRYLYPTPDSLNISQGDDSRELLDYVPGTEQESLIAEMIATEESQTRTSQQEAIKAVLRDAMATLEPQSQTILELYYSQHLNQNAIAKQLEIKQYTVSRRLTKAKEILLRCLASWSQDNLHISLTTDVLTNMTIVIEEWLHNYYGVFTDTI